MSVFRAYFYDAATREELDHELSGKTWLAMGGNCHVSGRWVRGTTTQVLVADYADLRLVTNERKVTAADFDRPVIVKMWAPNGHNDWRLLRRDDSPLTPAEQVQADWCESKSSV